MTREDIIRSLEDDILEREGWPEYSNRAADRGGPTKGGITLDTLSQWRGRPCSIEELKELSEPEARLIYRKRYIGPWQFIPDNDLFYAAVDYAVTSWHDDPARALQTAVGFVGRDIDGIVGPRTRAAIMAYSDPKRLKNRLVGYRARHMVNLALNDAKLKALIKGHNDLQLLNLRGWMNRVTSFLE